MTLKGNDLDALRTSQLRKLISEVEGRGTVEGPGERALQREERRQARVFLLPFIRWAVFGVVCLGVGFWSGQQHALLRWQEGTPPRGQLMAAEGWRGDGTGVFYRWCRGEGCHAPRLYGGGVIQMFEVACVDRPCGDLEMRFNVLNAKGEVIDAIALREQALRGETRRFLVESPRPEAVSLELSAFVARARV